MAHIIASPWLPEAGEYGKSMGDTLAAALMKVPQMRYELAQRQQQQDATARQNAFDNDLATQRLGFEKNRDTREQGEVDSKAAAVKTIMDAMNSGKTAAPVAQEAPPDLKAPSIAAPEMSLTAPPQNPNAIAPPGSVPQGTPAAATQDAATNPYMDAWNKIKTMFGGGDESSKAQAPAAPTSYTAPTAASPAPVDFQKLQTLAALNGIHLPNQPRPMAPPRPQALQKLNPGQVLFSPEGTPLATNTYVPPKPVPQERAYSLSPGSVAMRGVTPEYTNTMVKPEGTNDWRSPKQAPPSQGLPLPISKAQLKPGQVYSTSKGAATWDGEKFIPVQK